MLSPNSMFTVKRNASKIQIPKKLHLRMGFEQLELRCLLASDMAPLLDINTLPIAASSAPANFVTVGSTVFFTAFTSANGRELWKTDGTAAGTVLVKDIRAGYTSSNPAYMTEVGGVLFFRASNGNGHELWKSDGTAAGTVMVKDLRVGNALAQIRQLTT